MSLVKLEEKFIGRAEVRGMEFELVKRSERFAVYRVQDGRSVHYETIVIGVSGVCIDFAKKLFSEVDFKETYPKANSWGVKGWTYRKLESALNKFERLESDWASTGKINHKAFVELVQ